MELFQPFLRWSKLRKFTSLIKLPCLLLPPLISISIALGELLHRAAHHVCHVRRLEVVEAVKNRSAFRDGSRDGRLHQGAGCRVWLG